MSTTREEQIAAIRAACIKANPEILVRGYDSYWDDTKEDVIRLSDVLLAIGHTGKDIVFSPGKHGKDIEAGCFGLVVKGDSDYDDKLEINWSIAFWNLRTDDLTAQSDECIAFLAHLLAA